MKVGVFGGTFDPIHAGHLAVASQALRELALDRVLFVPAGQPWMKTGRRVSDVKHRLRMASIAADLHPRFEVCDLEARRPGASYTVDTLRALRRQLGARVELHLILGVDAVNQLHRWREPAAVLDLAAIVCARRPRIAGPDASALESIAEGASGGVIVLQGPDTDVSGEDIRRRIHEGLPVRGLLPDGVEDYARRHGLYAGPCDAGGAARQQEES